MADFWVEEAQLWVNATYGSAPGWTPVEVDGRTGWRTLFALTRALQVELGIATLSDTFGPTTTARFRAQVGALTPQSPSSNLVRILRCALWCSGYQGGDVRDGTFDDALALSVVTLTRDMGLPGTGARVDVAVLRSLLTMATYRTAPGGSDRVREVQRWLNGRYVERFDYTLVPCDGRYARELQRALVLGVQYEVGLADGVANGNVGPATQTGLRGPALVEPGSVDAERSFVRLFQGALLCHGHDAAFDGTFGGTTVAATRAFQEGVALERTGRGDFATWMALLVSTGDPDRPARGCDTATPLTAPMAAGLVEAGYRTVGRYMSVAAKRYRREELDTLLDAGLTTFPIYQELGDDPTYFTDGLGYTHGLAAARRARQLGFAPGTVVHFAVDFDATPDDIETRVVRYFEGVQRGIGAARPGGYRVGVYGSRAVGASICARGLAVSAFVAGMSRGWDGNAGHVLPPQWAYDQVQTLTVGTGHGAVEIDKVVVSPRAEPVGRDGLLATPHGSDPAGFHQLFWALTELRVGAEVAMAGASDEARAHTDDLVLHHVQRGDAADADWTAWTPRVEATLTGPVAPEVAAARARFLATDPPVPGPDDYTGDVARLAASTRAWARWGVAGLPEEVGAGDLGGWGLDLVALWAGYATVRAGGDEPRGGPASWIAARIGTDLGSFTRADLVAGVDAYLVARAREADPARDAADVLREVLVGCETDPAWRYGAFLDARFGGSPVAARAAVADLFDPSTAWTDGPVRPFAGVRRPGQRRGAGQDARELRAELPAVSRAFVTVLWRLAGRPLS